MLQKIEHYISALAQLEQAVAIYQKSQQDEMCIRDSVKEDGTGELVYTKAQKTKKSNLTNQSYDVFLKLATSKSMPDVYKRQVARSSPYCTSGKALARSR